MRVASVFQRRLTKHEQAASEREPAALEEIEAGQDTRGPSSLKHPAVVEDANRISEDEAIAEERDAEMATQVMHAVSRMHVWKLRA